MKVQEIFDRIIERGIKADVRGKKGIEEALDQTKKDFEKLPKERQKYFDKEIWKLERRFYSRTVYSDTSYAENYKQIYSDTSYIWIKLSTKPDSSISNSMEFILVGVDSSFGDVTQ